MEWLAVRLNTSERSSRITYKEDVRKNFRDEEPRVFTYPVFDAHSLIFNSHDESDPFGQSETLTSTCGDACRR
jgi:hypothetical protein